MQFGVFSVGDITPDPTTGRAVTEAERIQIMITVALKAEEIGLDVFAASEGLSLDLGAQGLVRRA